MCVGGGKERMKRRWGGVGPPLRGWLGLIQKIKVHELLWVW